MLKSRVKNLGLVSKLAPALAVLMSLGVGALAVRQLFYGVNLWDEGAVVAITWRFLLGDWPIRDEANIIQFSSMLTFPLFKLYYFCVGSSEGIVFYGRVLYLLFRVFLAYLLFRWSRVHFDRAISILISLFAIVFVPAYNVPTVNYTTLGAGFLFAALLWSDLIRHARYSRHRAMLAGVFFGLSAINYPTLLPIVVVGAAFLPPRRHRWLAYDSLVGMLIVFLPFIFYALFAFNDLKTIVTLQRAAGYGENLAPLVEAGLLRFNHLPKKFALVAGVATLIWLARKEKRWSPILCLAIPVVASRAGAGPQGFAAYVFMAAPVFLFLSSSERRRNRGWLLRIWLPALFTAFAAGTFSSGGIGIMAATVGFHIGAFIVMVMLTRGLREQTRSAWLPLVIPVYFLVTLSPILMGPISGDCPFDQLTRRVERGPYRGLYTTEEKNAYLERFRAELVEGSEKARPGRLLVYPFFPAAYLFFNRPVGAPTVYGFRDPAGEAVFMEYLSKRGSEISEVISVGKQIIFCNANADPWIPASQIDAWVKTNFTLQKQSVEGTRFFRESP